MGPLSRPLTSSGQWSQTTTGISQPGARLSALSRLDFGISRVVLHAMGRIQTGAIARRLICPTLILKRAIALEF